MEKTVIPEISKGSIEMPSWGKAVPEEKLVCMPEKDPTTIDDSAAATLCEPNHQDSHRIWHILLGKLLGNSPTVSPLKQARKRYILLTQALNIWPNDSNALVDMERELTMFNGKHI